MLLDVSLILLVGLAVGVIARLVMPGARPMGWTATTLLGIWGAFLAGVVGQAIGLYRLGEAGGWIGAAIGALILLVIYHRTTRNA